MSDSQNNSYDLIEIDRAAITTILGTGVELNGTIRCTTGKTVLISGAFIGDIQSNGAVIIEEAGLVRGSIHAKKIHLSGTIDETNDSNSIVADERIVITKTGKLKSKTLSYGELHMDFGSRISAKMTPMTEEDRQGQTQTPGIPVLTAIAVAAPAAPAYVATPVSEFASAHKDFDSIPRASLEIEGAEEDNSLDGLDLPNER